MPVTSSSSGVRTQTQSRNDGVFWRIVRFFFPSSGADGVPSRAGKVPMSRGRGGMPDVPTRGDGSPYRYEMVCDNGWARVYGDTPQELLCYLIKGYGAMTGKERAKARLAHAVEVQVRLQAQINVFFAESEQTNGERTILQGPRTSPPMIREWFCEVPLMLVDMFYLPYSRIMPPRSGREWVVKNLWWLRPAESEMAYLKSLHDASFIDINVSKTAF